MLGGLKQRVVSAARSALGRVPAPVFWGAHELFVPLYHMVADEPLPHLRRAYEHHTVRSFEQQIDDLLRHFAPVSIAEVIAAMRGGPRLPRRSMFVTFDDGMRQIGENAIPVLQRKGVPAVIFAVNVCVDNGALMPPHTTGLILDRLADGRVPDASRRRIAELLGCEDAPKPIEKALWAATHRGRERVEAAAEIAGIDLADYLARERPYHTRAELRDLATAGVLIGGHSVDHPKYRVLSLDDQIAQTEASMRFVVDEFSPPVRAFAFPFGDLGVPRQFFDRLQAANTFDISFGTARLRDDVPGHVQRLPMDVLREPTDRILSRAYAERFGRRLVGRNRLARD